ncbi:MAG: hypothetical protein K6G03_08655, partial [Lachnospiraceae bacterium]|nr:hypothetical protein [Lachnospiraceae bacterium]
MLMQCEPVYQAYLEALKHLGREVTTDEISDTAGDTEAGRAYDTAGDKEERRASDTAGDTATGMAGRSAYDNKKPGRVRVIYLTPTGKVFNQKKAEELSGEEELIFLCGHYEGIDERVIDEIVTDRIS